MTDLITPGDIGHGLAWSYYYGYLKLILPGLRQRVNESEFAKLGTPFLKKFIAILPETSICPSSFDKEDENVKTIGAVEFSVSISGNVMRNYKTAVHQVTDPRDKNKVSRNIMKTFPNYVSVLSRDIKLKIFLNFVFFSRLISSWASSALL